jgi:hypothetical protein
MSAMPAMVPHGDAAGNPAQNHRGIDQAKGKNRGVIVVIDRFVPGVMVGGIDQVAESG